MYQIVCPIISKQTLKPTLWSITVGLGETGIPLRQTQPGQFFLVQCADPFSTYLRRAIFPINILTDSEQNSNNSPSGLQFLFSATDLADPGLAWLISRNVGETVDLLGPFGQGFPQPRQEGHLLLIGSGSAIGPLLFLLHEAVQHKTSVVLALEAARALDLYPTQTLPPAVELHIATMDGSLGYRGSIFDHLADLTRWADMLCAVGSSNFYRQLKQHLQQTRFHLSDDFAHVLTFGMPIHICGVGICTLCTVPTTEGLKLACQDGPVFSLATLFPEAPL